MIKLDFKYVKTPRENNFSIDIIKEKLFSSPMTGWLDYKLDTTKVKEIANRVKEKAEVFIVIGIGGSYLGSKAIIDSLTPYFKKSKTEVIYAGTNLSSEYMNDLLTFISSKEVMINLISKSGSTLEPNIAFDLIKKELEKKYSKEELASRIIITTETDNNLDKKANDLGYQTLEIPKDIGGRFSCLTPVGLLPIAVAGYDIDELLRGSEAGKNYYKEAYDYALLRHANYQNNKYIEAFTIYEEKLYMFTEWFKQLFAESQGKDYKGILPISVVNTRDLHSLGQFIQEGNKVLFETVLKVNESKDIELSAMSLNTLNHIALDKVCEAHLQDNSESLIIEIDKIDEYHLGQLIYFFYLSVSIGGLMLEVNPFDQPGVSKYKKLLEEAIN